MTTREELNRAPIGSILRCSNPNGWIGAMFRKVADDEWLCTVTTLPQNNCHVGEVKRDYSFTAQYYDLTINSARSYSQDELRALPIGSHMIITTGPWEGSEFRKTQPTVWTCTVGGGHLHIGWRAAAANFGRSEQIIVLPDDAESTSPGWVPRSLIRLEEGITQDELDHLPEGTIVTDEHGRGAEFRLIAGRLWRRDGRTGLTETVDQMLVGSDGGSVGACQVITLPNVRGHDEMNRAGVGSVIYLDESEVRFHVKMAGGDWRSVSNNRTYPERDFVVGRYRWVRFVEPQSLDSETQIPQVGTVISSREELVALPVGSTLMAQNYRTYRKVANNSGTGEWVYDVDDKASGQSHNNLSTARYNVVTRVGPVESETSAPVFEIGQELDREQFLLTPIGSKVTCERGSRHHYERVSEDRWTRDGYRYGPNDFPPTVIYATHPTNADLTVELAQMKARARAAIDECVEGEGHGDVRDGVYWEMGLENLPAMNSTVQFGSIFGLPDGSLVSIDWRGTRTFWLRQPGGGISRVAGPQRELDRSSMVTVQVLGDFEAPTFRGPKHFLHTLWEKQRFHRGRLHWCSAVENCLEGAGLEDPGDVPEDVVVPQVAPVQALAVGDQVVCDEATGGYRRLLTLPVGSVVSSNGGQTYLRTPTAYVRTDNLAEALEYASALLVTVSYIAEVHIDQPF